MSEMSMPKMRAEKMHAEKPARRDNGRRDPAPSRLAYRAHRLWLTPMVRKFLRYGMPVMVISAVAGGYFASETRREATADWVAEQRRAIEERPEFRLNMMAVDGASIELSEDIREILPFDFPMSRFDLDLEEARATIAELDAVADARIMIRSGGILQVNVTERLPAVVWRGRDEIELLDKDGHRVARVPARASRPDLPLIAGLGADRHVPEARAVLAATSKISDRVRGLVRMGERRWDLVLDRDQRILLPETNPVAALERVIELEATRDLLARDVAIIDMRNPDRPTLRIGDAARAELQRIKQTELDGSGSEGESQ